MKRLAYQYLINWKTNPAKKPLVIRGARQVGKTWLMKHFGENEYDDTVYVNFEESAHLRSLFQENFNVERILTALQVETGKKIIPGKTLIILDEIQEAPGGLTALKYFYESSLELDVMVAGSYLGMPLGSFPVGKVEFLDLYPMNFAEFLMAIGDENLLDLILHEKWDLVKIFKDKYIERLMYYYITGGMPEVVKTYSEQKDFTRVRKIQKDILLSYELDFGKHAPVEILPRIRMVWDAIPSQLAEENKKFIFGHIKKGARAKDFEKALQWLVNSGLIHKIFRISKPALPLKSYANAKAFKVFLNDTGLLAAMAGLDVKIILEGSKIFTGFKGAFTEQYVMQQLKPCFTPYYWASGNSSEIDFVFQNQNQVVAIEVKANENLKSKSLRFFCRKYELKNCIRLSLSGYRKEDWMVNIPLYAVPSICYNPYETHE